MIITCINREYAKKLVVQLPRQKHPYHFHQKKTETSTVRRLLAEQNTHAPMRAVIGDGESDRASAEAVGARFFAVRFTSDLQRLGLSWGLLHG